MISWTWGAFDYTRDEVEKKLVIVRYNWPSTNNLVLNVDELINSNSSLSVTAKDYTFELWQGCCYDKWLNGEVRIVFDQYIPKDFYFENGCFWLNPVKTIIVENYIFKSFGFSELFMGWNWQNDKIPWYKINQNKYIPIVSLMKRELFTLSNPTYIEHNLGVFNIIWIYSVVCQDEADIEKALWRISDRDDVYFPVFIGEANWQSLNYEWQTIFPYRRIQYLFSWNPIPNINKLQLPMFTNYIFARAFANIDKINELVFGINENVTIGDWCFANKGLKKISLMDWYDTFYEYPQYCCGRFFNIGKEAFKNNDIEEYPFNDYTTTLWEGAFMNNKIKSNVILSAEDGRDPAILIPKNCFKNNKIESLQFFVSLGNPVSANISSLQEIHISLWESAFENNMIKTLQFQPMEGSLTVGKDCFKNNTWHKFAWYTNWLRNVLCLWGTDDNLYSYNIDNGSYLSMKQIFYAKSNTPPYREDFWPKLIEPWNSAPPQGYLHNNWFKWLHTLTGVDII